jgi:hypothetical protein
MNKSLVCAVAGISFYQDNLDNLSIGDKLDIIPQPENPYDPGALAVYKNGKQLGYLPRKVAERFNSLRISGEVIYILKGKLTGLRIRLFLDQDNITKSKVNSISDEILVRDKRNNRILGFLINKDNGLAYIKSKNSTIKRRLENLEFSSEPLSL